MSDLITIAIPTCRRPTMLLHCLHSCVTQDYRPLEIDISDNSSSDETQAVVESVPKPEGIQIRYWRNNPPIGPVENQKMLFAAAKGDRLIWMNDDDVLLPGAVSAMATAFSLEADIIAAYGMEEIIHPAGERQPQLTAHSNAMYRRTPHYAGVRRDLLVCALWRQMPHVGFLVQTDAARKIGLRDRSEVGLAVDVDFAIRLAQNYRHSAIVLLDRATVQTRFTPKRLSQTEPDVCRKLYDIVEQLPSLSVDEARARDQLLTAIAPVALRENALVGQRLAALRIFLSRTYPHGQSWLNSVCSLGLIVVPNVAHALRRLARTRHERQEWILPDSQEPTASASGAT